MTVKLASNLSNFLKDAKAAIMPLFSVLLIPVLAASAAAVDYSIWLGTKTELQAVADAAALGAVKKYRDGGDADAIAEAEAIISAHGLGGIERQIEILESGATLRVRLTAQGDPVMSGVMSKEAVLIGASATATSRYDGPTCMLALNPDTEWGIQIQGSAQLHAEGCSLWSNANGHNSFRSYPATRTRASRICAVGGVNVRGNIDPQPRSGCRLRKDPLAKWQQPTPGPCLSASAAAGTIVGGVLHLQPGTYCGGLALNTGTVVLEPGIYTIKDGPFALHGNVQVSGVGVGIFLHGIESRLHFAGTGTFRIEAPQSGRMAGIVIARDRNSISLDPSYAGPDSTIIGNFTLSFYGTIYLPNQTFSFWGNSDSQAFPKVSQVIADRIEVGGSGVLTVRALVEESAVPVAMLPEEFVRLIR